MEFGFSKELDLLREMYKKFAETEIKPLAEELDEEERFPVESIPKLARYGFMGIPFPKEYQRPDAKSNCDEDLWKKVFHSTIPRRT